MALVEVRVPDIGDFKDVAVIELLVKPGDTVKAEQSLITVESDKASMEIPSSADGVVKELRVSLGDKVSEGSPLLMLESANELDVPLPLTGLTQQMFRAAIAKGHGEEDICSSIKVLEEIAGVTVEKK